VTAEVVGLEEEVVVVVPCEGVVVEGEGLVEEEKA
jgi:hypothetical protein